MASPAILAIKIIADASQASKTMDDAAGKTSKWSSGLSKAAGVATVGLAAVGAVLVSGVKSAAEDAQAQAVLAKALENSAGATKGQIASTEDWISAQTAATGVTDDELRPALGNLVRATGSVAKSQDAMKLAMDISAATGKDLNSVSQALAKGYAGNTTSLGRLVPGLDAATLASKDMNAISAELSDQVGGSAAAAAGTAAGQYQIFSAELAETKEGIGAALLPVLTKLTGSLSEVAQWAAKNTGVLTVLIGIVSALAAIIVTVNAVTKAWTAIQAAAKAATVVWTGAQAALNFVLSANPIGLVIIAIGLLVAAIVVAYKQSDTFRRIVDAAFGAVLDAARAAWSWIKGNWPLLLAVITGPIGAAVLIVVRHWDQIKDGAQAALSWIRGAWSAVSGWLVAPFESAADTIAGIIARIRDLISGLIGAIKSIPVPHIPHIPGLNVAGTAAVASSAVAGPMARGGAGAAGRASTGRAGGTGPTIVIQGALDPEGVARQVRRILGGHDVRMGRQLTVTA